MLKYLVLFAFFLGMAIFVARQDERASQESAQKAKNLANAAIAAKPDANHPQQNVPDTERHTPGWYGFFRWPSGTTTWAIILTLLAVAEQAKYTAKTAKAAQESAEVARLNAQAAERQLELMRAESRARLEVRPGYIEVIGEEGDSCWQLHTHIRLRNVGKSSAYIIRCMGEFYCDDSLETKSFNGYTLDPLSAVIEPSATLICGAAGTAFVEFDRPIKDVAEAIARTEIFLIFRGFVEYETQGTKWHRDFWYVWINNDRARESGFTFPPNIIERMRDGSWEVDPEQKNSEYEISPNPN